MKSAMLKSVVEHDRLCAFGGRPLDRGGPILTDNHDPAHVIEALGQHPGFVAGLFDLYDRPVTGAHEHHAPTASTIPATDHGDPNPPARQPSGHPFGHRRLARASRRSAHRR